METAEYARMAEVEQRHWWFRGRLAVVRRVLRRFVPPGVGLDCSSGTGMTLSALPQWVQTGADLSPEALRHCAGKGHPRLARADLTRLPFGDARFDVLTCLDTLEHIEDDTAALAEIHRVLKPGGYALMTVPAHPWMFSAHDRALHHVRRYRRAELRQRVADSGLEIVRLRWINSVLFPLIASARLVSRDKGEKSDTGSVPPGPVNAALYAAFASDAWLLPWLPAPFGVSLLCLARKP